MQLVSSMHSAFKRRSDSQCCGSAACSLSAACTPFTRLSDSRCCVARSQTARRPVAGLSSSFPGPPVDLRLLLRSFQAPGRSQTASEPPGALFTASDSARPRAKSADLRNVNSNQDMWSGTFPESGPVSYLQIE